MSSRNNKDTLKESRTMLKTKKLLELADHIETCQDIMDMWRDDGLTFSRNKFTMFYVFLSDCGSPACISGHGLALHGYNHRFDSIHDYPLDEFAKLYGLNDEQRDGLCAPTFTFANWSETRPSSPGFISARHAAFTIRHLARTRVADYVAGRQLMIEDDQKKADVQKNADE